MPTTSDSRLFKDLVELHPKAKKVLAEGDSWFAYPGKYAYLGRAPNIIAHLNKKDDLVIYDASSNSDEAIEMLSGKQKFSLLKRISHTEFDYILFSGGGNDIVGRYDFGFLLNTKTPEMTWRQCINDKRLKLRFTQIASTYEYLCELVLMYSKKKDVKIVAHTYDYPIPSPRGYKAFDIIPLREPWLYPYFYQKEIFDHQDQKNIITYILKKFHEALKRISRRYPSLVVVNTQRTLRENHWNDEIHPTSEGFKLISEKIYKAISSTSTKNA
ncbi:SGNH/GDSL hydrolase family protein [Enterovibrio calviensis]|uniref:SGNH/GDSL hydrolase family protein n=1 Tax=Enterovibrio calviensis TaxID=91359 RepID=UPI0004867CA8|nr:SGNH/GDSL hydrolase family protein [Enterovibrio calviensis]